MPFTPFHMGAGLTAKAVLDGRMSLISFGVAQVLMDLEPGLHMLTGKGVGALFIGFITALVAPFIVRPIVDRLSAPVES